jgi:hypothetical protein
MKTYGGSGYVDPRIIDLDISWRCLLHVLAALPPGKEPLVPTG